MRYKSLLFLLFCFLCLTVSGCGNSDSAVDSGAGATGSATPGGGGGGEVPGSFGSAKWHFSIGSNATSIDIVSSPAIAPDGTIYVGSGDHFLYARNPDGTKKWRYETGDMITASPAIGSDGTIYVGSADRQLYAIRPNGTLKWVFPTKSVFTASPAIGADGTIYAAGTNLDHTIFGCPKGNTITVQLSDVYAINPDGTSKWTLTLSGTVNSSPAVATSGTIYVGSSGDVVFDRSDACDTTTAYPPSDADPSYPVNGHLYAINPNGTLKWDFKTLGHVDSSPAIAADGTERWTPLVGQFWG